MKRELIRTIIDTIVNDFGNILVEELSDNSENYPYTNACIDFIADLQTKGITINFDAFDQEILDQVYRELVSILTH